MYKLLYPCNDLNIAISLNEVGNTYNNLKKYNLAIKYLEESL